MKKLLILLMAMLIFSLVSGIGAANNITVNSTDSIQAAVNSAASGDAIIVKPGIYTENIQVTKPNLVIRSESGNPEDTIIGTDSNTTVFTVKASNTTISGFKVEFGNSGIYLTSCNGCTINDNDLSGNRYGISLISSNNNKILGNRANSNKMFGIHLDNSGGNTLLNNSVNSNTRGINSITSNNNNISGNNALNNSQYGMWISQSNDNNIFGNTINECGNGEAGSGGIHQNSSSRNIISGNIVAFNNGYGLFECPACHNNRVYNNYINNDRNANINTIDTTWNIEKIEGKNIVGGRYIGGNFWGNPEGTGFSQTAVDEDEDKDGIIDSAYIDSSNNIIDNLPLVLVSNPQLPVLPVANFSINMTSGYAPLVVQFTDLSENATSISWDTNDDGIPDNSNKTFVKVYETPGIYNVSLKASNKNGTTELKTMQINVKGFKVYPVADFSANLTSGYAPLAVQFTDLSQNATSWNWNFGDGNTSIEKNSTHTYSAGTYIVRLITTNENGTSPEKTVQITVTEQNNSSGSSDSSSGGSHSSGGSGGGGGGGGSPEPATNVQVKEISQTQVSNGKAVKFDFTKNATCVVYVTFDAKKTAGKTTTIAEQLKAKSTLVSVPDSVEVYKYFNLWVGNSGFATSKNIENPVVCFKVEKTWIQDKKIDQNSITLNRYNDKKWSQIPAKYLKEDSKYLYFTAETPGFSFFAITGKQVEKQNVIETKPSTNTSKPEQKDTTSQTESEQKPKDSPTGAPGSKQSSITSMAGFETLYAIVCLLIVSFNKRRR